MRDGEPERSWPLLLAGVRFIAFGDLLESRLRTDVIYDCWQATTPCHALSLSLFSRWNNWAVALFFSRVGLPFVLHSSWLDALFHLLSYYSSFPLASFSFTERHHKKKREEEKRRKKNWCISMFDALPLRLSRTDNCDVPCLFAFSCCLTEKKSIAIENFLLLFSPASSQSSSAFLLWRWARR